MNFNKNKAMKIVLPIVIILAGFAVMQILVLRRPAPQKEIKEHPGLLTEVVKVRTEDRKIRVFATGTVKARQEATLTPQVSGVITFISPYFIAGGFFKKGELLFKVEDLDYRLAVDRAKAAIAQAELELAKEESNARIADLEWRRMTKNNNDRPNPLVLYKPQLKKARANVLSAKAELTQAELNLRRTSVSAPFNCRIRRENIDWGQYVSAGASIGTVAGTDIAEIEVPLSLKELQWIDIPVQGSKKAGSPATLEIKAGSRAFRWDGRVVRSLGEFDPKSRMAKVIVAVNDPYQKKAQNIIKGKPDLEIEMFVEVVIDGDILKNVIPIPRRALRHESTVWIVDEQNKLRIRHVKVVRKEHKIVLIKEGLKDGDLLVLTSLPGAADGMKLRPFEQGATKK